MSSQDTLYIPPNKVESLFSLTQGNTFASTNAPTAGSQSIRSLPIGSESFQYYSLATPNGQKPAILLEELNLPYDAHKISLNGEQFQSGFVELNPNSKIPAAIDLNGPNGKTVKLFESVSIMVYLAEKTQQFIPSDPILRSEVMNWLFWQVGGQGPITGACFGHFFAYAPEDQHAARDYALGRYGMEVQRLCSVLNNHLATRTYLVGEEYTIADMACFPWFQTGLRTGYKTKSGLTACEFLSIEENYPHVVAWADRILARPAVQRGLRVCSFSSENPKPWLDEESDEQK